MSAAANDTRPVCFTSRASAIHHMWRAARLDSPTGQYRAVEFLDDAYQAVEGGTVYQLCLGNLDWEVRALSPTETGRRVQAGMRAAVASLYERALAHDAAVEIAKMRSVKAMHTRYAAECRSSAREIETRITISGVRDIEPVTSSELDNRFLEAR